VLKFYHHWEHPVATVWKVQSFEPLQLSRIFCELRVSSLESTFFDLTNFFDSNVRVTDSSSI
jgi:hypothetical protein